MAYGSGEFAPGIPRGDAGQYAAGHNMILAHAAAAEIYDNEFRSAQGGRVGVALNTFWCAPAAGAAGAGGGCCFKCVLLLAACVFARARCRRLRSAAAAPACPAR